MDQLSCCEISALGSVMVCVNAEADRMRDADPKIYDLHTEAIERIGRHLDTGCPFTLDEAEAAAVRWLLDGGEWETVDPEDLDGFASLHAKLTVE